MKASRSALGLGIAGAVFFLAAGVYGLTAAASPVFVLFVLVGLAGIVGGVILWRKIEPRA